MIKRLIREFEGLRLKAYQCQAGVWTIGYGHTANVSAGMQITEEEAERLLDEDLRPILALLPKPLASHRRAALASLAFNIGVNAFAKSTILRKVRENPADHTIPGEFARWVYVKGKKSAGLGARRAKEAMIYAGTIALTGCSTEKMVEEQHFEHRDSVVTIAREEIAATLHHVELTDTARRTIVIERVEIARSAASETVATMDVETSTVEQASQPATTANHSPLQFVPIIVIMAIIAILAIKKLFNSN